MAHKGLPLPVPLKNFLKKVLTTVGLRKLYKPPVSNLYERRKALSLEYIQGAGVEIGALHFPLPVAEDVTVRYLDRVSREVSVRKFPEIDGSNIVSPALLCDGLSLLPIRDCSQGFVIANHVLEHAADPIQSLLSWSSLLRPGGTLFLSVPIAERCFDNGRSITPVAHFIEDYRLTGEKKKPEMDLRNRSHCREWITVSVVNLSREMNQGYVLPTPEGLEKELDRMVSQADEIHFHTFTIDSFAEFLRVFSSEIDPTMNLETVAENHIEVIGVMRKR